MTRAISRDSFDELKNYLGVYLQQGRVLLDSDWNESQDIALSLLRRVVRDSVGDGTPNDGFRIEAPWPTKPLFATFLDPIVGRPNNAEITVAEAFGSLPFFMRFPGLELDLLDLQGSVELQPPLGNLRRGKVRTPAGRDSIRLSDHTNPTRVIKSLPSPMDLSSFEVATFPYRLSAAVAGPVAFFLIDSSGNRSTWTTTSDVAPSDCWISGVATPLDLRFHIVANALPLGRLGRAYQEEESRTITTFGGLPPINWEVTGALPQGLELKANPPFMGPTAAVLGVPTEAGDFRFSVVATDSTGAKASRDFTISIRNLLPSEHLPEPQVVWTPPQFGRLRTSFTPRPADLVSIQAYGYEVYQDATRPLSWDFGPLNLGSRQLIADRHANDFIIRGSSAERRNMEASLARLIDPDAPLRKLLQAEFERAAPPERNAARMYIGGLPCSLVRDTLYSAQCNPNDPPLKSPQPPQPGERPERRSDLVYLDTWQEAVTYVEDPAIRDDALGGPDTATRLQQKQCVRVAPGGQLPADDGRGFGTLSTEGSYRGSSNRLYLIEIDRSGDIGTATFRWSEDNASSIQPVIKDVPPGSMSVEVEDASAYRENDIILIRKEFGEEEHRIAAVSGNVLSLEQPTGAQLAQLPANTPGSDFATFVAQRDHPKVQRWNALHVPIAVDSGDPALSVATPISDGVKVRFGGSDLRKGDWWNFRTRSLPGDSSSNLVPSRRIENLDARRSQGVVHHYAPLGLLVRNAASQRPEQVEVVKDLRRRIGAKTQKAFPIHALVRTETHAGGAPLLASSPDSRFLVSMSGTALRLNPRDVAELDVEVSFYNDSAIDPVTDRQGGRVFEHRTRFPLTEGNNVSQRFFVDVPLKPTEASPSHVTSIHVFFRLLPLTETAGPLIRSVHAIADLTITEFANAAEP